MPNEGRSLVFEVQKNRRRLSVRVPGEWFGLKHDVVLNATSVELDALIAALGRTRAIMLEHPPLNYGDSVRHGPTNPRWEVAKEAGTGNPLLSIRHLGFGWVHFALPKQEAVKLGHALLLQATDPAPLN